MQKQKIFDTNGNFLKYYYHANNNELYRTLDDAKIAIKNKLFQKINFMFFDYESDSYLGFSIYSNI